MFIDELKHSLMDLTHNVYGLLTQSYIMVLTMNIHKLYFVHVLILSSL